MSDSDDIIFCMYINSSDEESSSGSSEEWRYLDRSNVADEPPAHTSDEKEDTEEDQDDLLGIDWKGKYL